MSILKPRLPQVSRKKLPKFHTDQSVCSMNSGGDKKLAKVKPKHSRILQILTYNVRTLSIEEKVTEVEAELRRIKWDIIGLSEGEAKISQD